MEYYVIDKDWSEKLKRLRIAKAVTATEVAAAVGFSKSKYCRLERCISKRVSSKDIETLSLYFDSDVAPLTCKCNKDPLDRIGQLEKGNHALRSYILAKWNEEKEA